MQRAGNEKTDRCSPLHNNEAWHEFYSKVSLSARRGDLVVISGFSIAHTLKAAPHLVEIQDYLSCHRESVTVHYVLVSESDL